MDRNGAFGDHVFEAPGWFYDPVGILPSNWVENVGRKRLRGLAKSARQLGQCMRTGASPWQPAKVDFAPQERSHLGQRSCPKRKPFRKGPARERAKKLGEHGGISGETKHGIVDHAGRLLAEQIRLLLIQRLQQVDICIHPCPQRLPLELVPKPVGEMTNASRVVPKDCGFGEDFGRVAEFYAGRHIPRGVIAIEGHAMTLPKDRLQTGVLDGSEPLTDPKGHAIRHPLANCGTKLAKSKAFVLSLTTWGIGRSR